MNTKQTIIQKAIELLEPEGAWIKGDWIQDADGNGLPFSLVLNINPAACKFCMEGAILQAIKLEMGNQPREQQVKVWRGLSDKFIELYDYTLMSFNDGFCESKDNVINQLKLFKEQL